MVAWRNRDEPKKRRRRWTPDKKLKIVLETLRADQKLAEICRRERILPTQAYHWRKQLRDSAEAIFGPPQTNGEDRRVAKLATEKLANPAARATPRATMQLTCHSPA